MILEERKQKALDLVDERLQSLGNITTAHSSLDSVQEDLKRWKELTVRMFSKVISGEEGDKLNRRSLGQIMPNQHATITKRIIMYREHLTALKKAITDHPEYILEQKPSDVVSEPAGKTNHPFSTSSKSVFIIFGHDEANALNLVRMLKERWDIDSVLLRDRPQRFRALLDKFEQEAQETGFAIALTTPDDLVVKANQLNEDKPPDKYRQPRPNVFLELGWFLAKMGREKVCIFHKKGTSIPSDLLGIGRAEFTVTVEDGLVDIERELKDFGLIEE